MATKVPAIIIGLTGAAGCGKRSAAAALVSQMKFVSVAFTDAVRREAAYAWCVDERVFTRDDTLGVPCAALAACKNIYTDFARFAGQKDPAYKPGAPRSPAWALEQWYLYRSRFSPRYFERRTLMWIRLQIAEGRRRIVVVDVHRKPEIALLRSAGALIMRMHAPWIHMPQETGDKADIDICNDGTLKSLSLRMVRFTQTIQGHHAVSYDMI